MQTYPYVLLLIAACSSPPPPSGPDPATCMASSLATCTKNSDCCTDICALGKLGQRTQELPVREPRWYLLADERLLPTE